MPLLVPVMAMESAAAGTRRSRQLAGTDENMSVSVSVSRRGATGGVLKRSPTPCLSRDHAYCTVGMILPDVITPRLRVVQFVARRGTVPVRGLGANTVVLFYITAAQLT
jgi:hypothetical protein